VGTLGKALILLPLAFLLWHYGSEFLAVDACLDAGQVYDYVQGVCRSDVQRLPYVPYNQRFGWLLAVVAASMLAGIITAVAAKRKR
jgi:hypothetical protein